MASVHSELGGILNNKYHRFIRLPKPIINKVKESLRIAEYYDALDLFCCLCELTHQHSFQSKLIYQPELIGIQRRLNSKLKPLGYKLVSRQVPIGIQKSRKLSGKERRWGFMEMQSHEYDKLLKRSEAIKELYELDKMYKRQQQKRARAKKIKAIQEDSLTALCLPLSQKEESDLKEFVKATPHLSI